MLKNWIRDLEVNNLPVQPALFLNPLDYIVSLFNQVFYEIKRHARTRSLHYIR